MGILDRISALDRESLRERLARLEPVDHQSRLNALKVAAGPGSDSLTTTIQETPLGQLATGAAKGVASTVVNLGSLAHKLPGMDVVAPDRTGAFSGHDTDVNAATTAQGTMQKIGKGAEQVAEFFIPGASEAGALAPVAKAVGKAGLIGRAATEAASAAGVTAAQGGDPTTAAAVGGAVPLAAAGLGAIAPKVANSLVEAKRAAFATGSNPGRGIVSEGIAASTLGSLSKKVTEARNAIGQQIGTVLALNPKATSTAIDLTNVIEAPIQKAETYAQTAGDSALLQRLQAMRAGIYDRFAKLNSSVSAATPKDAFVVKKILDDGINHAGNITTDANAKAVEKAIRRGLAKEVVRAVPEVGPLNVRYGDLAEASDAISDKMAASHGLQTFVSNRLNQILGGLVGYATHSPLETIGVLAGKAALTSTPAMSAGAQALRAAGSQTAQKVGARLAGAAASDATQQQMTPERLQAILAGQ